jgi:hypothetical protein
MSLSFIYFLSSPKKLPDSETLFNNDFRELKCVEQHEK